MSYEIRFDGGPNGRAVLDLVNISGWTAFGEWTDTLDPGAYPDVRRLVEDGHAPDTRALSGQLAAAIEAAPPDDRGAAAVAERLLELVGDGTAGESAEILDGANNDDDDE